MNLKQYYGKREPEKDKGYPRTDWKNLPEIYGGEKSEYLEYRSNLLKNKTNSNKQKPKSNMQKKLHVTCKAKTIFRPLQKSL